jgi:CYTH domain-containing protein
MAIEIERKFLVINDGWRENATSEIYYQGYLCSGSGRTVRVRIAGKQAYLTIKGTLSGIGRLEFEYPIPVEDAKILLEEICEGPLIHKRRFLKKYGGFLWEIDEFYGDNEGLVLAEIELEHAEQEFPKPPWVGDEVSHDKRYFNARLRLCPYKQWHDKKR